MDASWAIAADGEGGFDRHLLFGSSAIQYVDLGARDGGRRARRRGAGRPEALGLDALYPAFFVALLIGEVRSGRAHGVAAAGALIAFALVPVAPAGVPVLVASLASLLGLVRRARDERRRRPGR